MVLHLQTPRASITPTPSEDSLSFAELLDYYSYQEPQRGQILRGNIIEVRRDEIILDIGLKRDAIVKRQDLDRLSAEIVAELHTGMDISVYVLQPSNEDGELIVSINKAMEEEDWGRALKMLEDDSITEALVLDANKGGLLVRFGRLIGFVPNSHVESLPPLADNDELDGIKESLMGKWLQLKVIQVEVKRNRLILSERAARRSARHERLAQLQIGQTMVGRVVNLTNFGAFIDLGGVDGMIHISNIDHRHISHPSDILAIGDEVEVRIDHIDHERERIALNRKAILPDPWQTFVSTYKERDLLSGVVTNVVDFGVFVAAPSGAQGLVHTSRMTSLGTVSPRDMFREGDPILVRILKIDETQHHIELSLDEVSVDEQQAWMFQRRETETV